MAKWRERRRYWNKGSKRLKRISGKGKTVKRIFTLTKFIFLGLITLFFASFIIFPLLAFNLPSPEKILRREGFSTKILDRSGEVLYDIFSEQKRTPVSLNEVPKYLKKATIAIEDKNFYRHQGFDPTGIFRAVFNIIFKRKLDRKSTLTQQLVKNVLLTPERTIFRKIREFILAIQI